MSENVTRREFLKKTIKGAVAVVAGGALLKGDSARSTEPSSDLKKPRIIIPKEKPGKKEIVEPSGVRLVVPSGVDDKGRLQSRTELVEGKEFKDQITLEKIGVGPENFTFNLKFDPAIFDRLRANGMRISFNSGGPQWEAVGFDAGKLASIVKEFADKSPGKQPAILIYNFCEAGCPINAVAPKKHNRLEGLGSLKEMRVQFVTTTRGIIKTPPSGEIAQTGHTEPKAIWDFDFSK